MRSNPLKRLRYKPSLDELVAELTRRVDNSWDARGASWRERRERNWWALQFGRTNYTELLSAYYKAKNSQTVLTATDEPPGPPSEPPDVPWKRPGVRSRLSDLANLCLGFSPERVWA